MTASFYIVSSSLVIMPQKQVSMDCVNESFIPLQPTTAELKPAQSAYQ